VAPFLEEIKARTFQEWYSLRYIYSPLLQIVGPKAFDGCFGLRTVDGLNIT
jgi:hypothetical protein